MADTVQPQEGAALVDYQLALPHKQYLTFDQQQVSFVEAVISDNVYGNGTGRHVFRTLDPDFLAVLKTVMAAANPTLRFRLGFGAPTNTYWLPWQEHLITTHYAKFEGITNAAGHLIIINSENNLTRMRRPNFVATRKGKISAMVSAIAQAGGLESVVEETDGDFMLIQNFMDNVKFLMLRLLPRAISKKGIGGYLCYLRDNVLHFHTPDYQTTVKQINYYSAFGSGFEANDLSQSPGLWDSGLAGATFIAQDPATGDAKEISSDPSKVVKLAEGIYDLSSVPNGSANFLYHLSYNPVVELNAQALHAYATSRRQTFRVVMTLQKTVSIRHGDILSVVLDQQSLKSSDYAGNYLVASSTHTIKKQQVISVYMLERGENQPQRGSAVVRDGQNQLTPSDAAPGQSLNLLEAQSSELTKGAGKAASAKTFTVVADAQTGLPS